LRLKIVAALLVVGSCQSRDVPTPVILPVPPVVILDCAYTANWTGPAARVDDTPLTLDELVMFTLYGSRTEYSGPTHEPDYTYEITDPYVMLWELRDLSGGTHWVWMTTTDSGGLESDHSNVVTVDIDTRCG
jgi:hypothetical protein